MLGTTVPIGVFQPVSLSIILNIDGGSNITLNGRSANGTGFIPGFNNPPDEIVTIAALAFTRLF